MCFFKVCCLFMLHFRMKKSNLFASNQVKSEMNIENLFNCKIANLQKAITTISLKGLVITKQEPRSVTIPEKNKSPSKKLNVLNLTIRDSEIDFINVNVWGSANYIFELNEQINIGRMIEIKNPQIKLKTDDPASEEYRPWTPSKYELTINEKQSEIGVWSPENDREFEFFASLSNMLIRDHNDYYTLRDIILNDKELEKKNVNMLVAIRKIGEVQEIETKYKKIVNKLDIIVFDETHAAFKLTIWDRELIKYALTWSPKENVLFIIDAKVHYDEYNKTIVATATSKTIFILNPGTTEGYKLYTYAKVANIDIDYNLSAQIEVNELIQYNLRELELRIENKTLDSEFVSVYAFISCFDIDTKRSKVVSIKCEHCGTYVNHNDDVNQLNCQNPDCNKTPSLLTYFYDISVTLTDMFTSIERVKVASKCIEKILNVKAKDFLMLSEDEIVNLKWKLLLERWNFTLKVNSDADINNKKSNYCIKIIKIEPIR